MGRCDVNVHVAVLRRTAARPDLRTDHWRQATDPIGLRRNGIVVERMILQVPPDAQIRWDPETDIGLHYGKGMIVTLEDADDYGPAS